jgi:GDP-L-fucose synthase
MDDAKRKRLPPVSIWGSGAPTREFMHVDDCADALVHLLKNYSLHGPINTGAGGEISIRALAETIAAVTGYEGQLEFDSSKSDGMPRKSLDGARLAATGWSGGRPLRDGLESAYRHFLDHVTPIQPAPPELKLIAGHHA